MEEVSRDKKTYHTKCKNILRKVAKELGLDKDGYDLRTNYAGPAVRGETTLHTDKVYIQIGSEFGSEVLVRSCKGRKDYTGGTNMFVNSRESFDEIVTKAKRCMEVYI